ncbi:PilZ domain-containing protein [Bacillus mesophilum]|uniref:PilZ domain-containing protein n=2 Tax=Bacillus mesophilum TaxID=1071718 RepID=A0A7V7RPS3_9BACI|nr:PilZ domain-containing protein [Bacillus mesophilum]
MRKRGVVLMMRYKRDEGFRFQFRSPIPGFIQKPQQDSEPIAIIIPDMSPNGLKLYAETKLMSNELYEVHFTLNDQKMRILGTIVWIKQIGSTYTYGLQGINDKESMKAIVEGLKVYSKKAYQHIKDR